MFGPTLNKEKWFTLGHCILHTRTTVQLGGRGKRESERGYNERVYRI
jgi:hypothetical protein